MLLSVILHFIYEWMPNQVISVIAPVNESIWEHMKLIISSSLIFSIIEYFIYQKKKIPHNNFILSYGLASFLAVIIYLLLYVPLYDFYGHKVYIAISLLLLIFIFIQVLSSYIMNKDRINYGKVLGLLLIIVSYFLFGYFTYHPPKINLFYDHINKNYGIIK